ncbi:MAG: Omp28-related outer membrane protein [Bacteroidales bacterium]|nr:Omp28-related outer membrane protein [Bacteroidales bacterium]
MKDLFKYASLLAAAVMLFSCHGYYDPNDPAYGGGGEVDENAVLKITSDRNLIQTFGGDHANLTVTLGSKVITEEVIFFDGSNKIIDIPDFKFYAAEPGEYEIWANYGTYNSEKIAIKAISIEIPETPDDPNPGSTDFKTRVLMTEFTTTGCSYCPNMKILLHDAMADKTVADKVVFTTCHSGLINGKPDPAYIKTTFDDFCNITGFPTVNFDMYYSFNNYTIDKSVMQQMIDEFHSTKENVAAGIAVNSILNGSELVIKVTVKAAEEGQYRVGAFLLEDGIKGNQSGGAAQEWMNTHDDVIRYIDSKYGKDQYYGHLLGILEKGKAADHVFLWNLDEIWSTGAENGRIYGGYKWNPFVEENLHLAIFVSTVATDEKGNEYYYINNIIDCPVNGKTPYEYR